VAVQLLRRGRETDLILLWGSNARAAHPIFFHHVLKAVQKGARLIVVDPRRTESAAFGDLWLGIDVGTDIALSNTIAARSSGTGLEHRAFSTMRRKGSTPIRPASRSGRWSVASR